MDKLLLIVLLSLFSAAAFAQICPYESERPDHWCGYERTAEEDAMFDEFVRWFYIENNGSVDRDLDMIYMPLTVHLVGNTDGSARISVDRMLNLMCKLNNDFAMTESKIFFYLKQYNLINNTVWNGWVNPNGGSYASILNSIYKDPMALNSFLVGNAPTSSLCGVYMGTAVGAQVPGGMDVTFMSSGCLGSNSSTWAHEMGHYLSLPHTFWGWEGTSYQCNTPTTANWAEKVDGSNCHTTGDRICDTPPDYLSGRWSCSLGNPVSTCVQIDPNGESFQSDGTNYMSYASDVCMTKFTPHQIEAMHFQINTYRAGLRKTQQQFETQIWPGPLGSAPANASPSGGVEVATYNHVTFSWDPVENATHYIFQVSPVPNFSVLHEDAVLTTTSYTSTTLAPGRPNYYWRIRPFNNGDFCGGFLPAHNFGTGNDEFVSTDMVNSVQQMQITPNPVSGGQQANIRVTMSDFAEGRLAVYDVKGRLVYSRNNISLASGDNHLSLQGDFLIPGFYIVSLESDKGVANQKMIVR